MVEDFGLTKEELEVLKKLDGPKKIQDFLDTFKINFEEEGETCMSPRKVLQAGKCHCIEAAFLAALALRINGFEPLVVDLRAVQNDFDHVICVFKKNGKYGCISKSNHAAHRYREPIYRDVRELVMSIFHEYIDKKGRKNLRSFSVPVNLSKFDSLNWATSEEDLWEIAEALDDAKHFDILTRAEIASLRKADKIEIDVGNVTEYKDPIKRF